MLVSITAAALSEFPSRSARSEVTLTRPTSSKQGLSNTSQFSSTVQDDLLGCYICLVSAPLIQPHPESQALPKGNCWNAAFL